MSEKSLSARERELLAENLRLREANRRLQAECSVLERDKIMVKLTAELTESGQREGEKQKVINQLRAALDESNQRTSAFEHAATAKIGLRREIETLLGVGCTMNETAFAQAVDHLRDLQRRAAASTDEQIANEGLRCFIDEEDPQRDYVAISISRPSISGIGPTKAEALMHLAAAENGVIEMLEAEIKSWKFGTGSRAPEQAEERKDRS